MRNRVIRLPAAKRDLLECFVHIGTGSEDAAFRFFTAAQETFRDLAAMPQMGLSCPFQNARAQGLRRWHIRGFENYLVFYRPLEDGIQVVRVLHGARDVERLFE